MPQKTILIGASCILFSFILTTFFLFVSPKMSINAEEEPVLIDFKLADTTINTDEGVDSLAIFARASTSEVEGNISISVSLAPENGCSGDDCWQPQAQQVSLSLMSEGCDALGDFNIEDLVGCGNEKDGIFTGIVQFPQYSAIGDWKVYSIRVDEGIGDQALQVPIALSYDPSFTATVLGGERSVAFVNEGLVEDILAPVIEDYAFVPTSIDTTSNPASLTMYVRISDDMSGVRLMGEWGPIVPNIVFSPDEDPGYATPEEVIFELSLMTEGCNALPEALDVSGLVGCGGEIDGIYTATAEIPKSSTGGTWSVTGIYNLTDLLGNALETGTATFENESEVYDLLAPVIQAVTITPTEFDTTDAAQTVTFDIEITDDVSGVASINISLVPIVVGWEGTYWLDEYTITEGDALDGTFRLTVELPQGAPIGFWRVNNIDVEDTLGRSDRYTTSELSLAFPSLSLYLLNQGTTEEVTLAGDWTLEDWPYYDGETVVWPDISVRFTEGTTITKEEGGVFAFQRMLATKYDLGESGLSALLTTVNSEYTTDLADCDASEGCVGTTLNSSSLVGTPLHIVKFGIPGLNLTFSKPVTIILGVDPEYLGQTFVLQTFDEEEGEWVNHGSCTVAMVIPPSTEHGGDQYGVTKPIAYPGCSFTTDHASFFSTNVLGAETEVEQAEDLPGVPKTGFEPGKSFWINKYLVW